MAIARKGQSAAVQVPRHGTMPDVAMKSIGSGKFDPDDLYLEEHLASMANATMGQETNIVHSIELSAISNLKKIP